MSSSSLQVVVGLGKTGLSVIRFLRQKGYPVAVVDSRGAPPGLDVLKETFPEVPFYLGNLVADVYTAAARLIVSPGISRQSPAFEAAICRGTPIVGDIELFAEQICAPVIAITGTNAKSTVTMLMGEMIKQAGKHVAVGGNIGTPALDLLMDGVPDYYVLELSSFQLETTNSLLPRVATILNITPDHLDRYDSFEAYIEAKRRIYDHCVTAVWNRADLHTKPTQPSDSVSFGLDEPPSKEAFGILWQEEKAYLAKGDTRLLPVAQMSLRGQHNWANALACLAMGDAIALPMTAMLETLRTFSGLAHRCQCVRELRGVVWFDDSKATNVGATIAAIEGVSHLITGKIVLIAGGLSKGVSFEPLQPMVATHVKAIVAMGEDKEKLQQTLCAQVPVCLVADMAEAVRTAQHFAQPGDAVLLAPACASFDMFRDYAHRGDVFIQQVNQLTA